MTWSRLCFFLRVQFTDLPQHNMSAANPVVNYLDPIWDNKETPEWNINENGDLEMWVEDSQGTEQLISTGTVRSVQYFRTKSAFPHPSHASQQGKKPSKRKKTHKQVLCFTTTNMNGKGEVDYFFKLRSIRVNANSVHTGVDASWLFGIKGEKAIESKLCLVFLFVGARVD
jgi:hypothetical protein